MARLPTRYDVGGLPGVPSPGVARITSKAVKTPELQSPNLPDPSSVNPDFSQATASMERSADSVRDASANMFKNLGDEIFKVSARFQASQDDERDRSETIKLLESEVIYNTKAAAAKREQVENPGISSEETSAKLEQARDDAYQHTEGVDEFERDVANLKNANKAIDHNAQVFALGHKRIQEQNVDAAHKALKANSNIMSDPNSPPDDVANSQETARTHLDTLKKSGAINGKEKRRLEGVYITQPIIDRANHTSKFNPQKIIDDVAIVDSRLGVTNQDYETYRLKMRELESDHDYSVRGGKNKHYKGAYQMGDLAITDAARVLGVAVPTDKEFLADGEMQDRFFEAYTFANHQYMMSNQEYAEMTPRKRMEALGFAHNQGHGPAKAWINTGIDTQDGFKTWGTKYTTGLAASWVYDEFSTLSKLQRDKLVQVATFDKLLIDLGDGNADESDIEESRRNGLIVNSQQLAQAESALPDIRIEKAKISKNGYDMLFGDNMNAEWLAANRSILNVTDYKAFLRGLNPGTTRKTEPQEYLRFLNLADDDPLKAMEELAILYGRDEIAKGDFKSLYSRAERNTKEAKGRPYSTEIRQYVRQQMAPSTFDPKSAYARQLDSLFQFDDWMEENKDASREEMRKQGQVIIDDYKRIRYSSGVTEIPVPRFITVERGQIDEMHLDKAKEETKRKFRDGSLNEREATTQAALLRRWADLLKYRGDQ